MLRRTTWLACLLGALLGGPVLADGGDSRPTLRPADPDYEAAQQAIKNADYAVAIQRLETYTRRRPDDADGWNWLGYASRKSGRLDAAFAYYDKALRLDPEHRGAHEYLGEAYLMAGKLAQAEAQLRILDRLCWLPCEEYRDLKRAVATFKDKAASR